MELILTDYEKKEIKRLKLLLNEVKPRAEVAASTRGFYFVLSTDKKRLAKKRKP